ncbi:hypothetical protein JKP88DRAFT_294768 [Tribonema minus]|uniref:Enoyl reductase (ER) domain-containing protein n=1 Tax=Tribonema minus TaxID=303371 RepID=A0A836CNP4_9STRA|nr:hypothetical protein JKP88DRAFT_294768 [Tribonema minus]
MAHMLKVGDNDTPSGVATMKAVVVSKYGRSATRAMSMRDDFPRPVRPGPSEVIIQVQAAGLNKMDIAKAKGQMKSLLGEETLPYAVGYDFSGVVERVGSETVLQGIVVTLPYAVGHDLLGIVERVGSKARESGQQLGSQYQTLALGLGLDTLPYAIDYDFDAVVKRAGSEVTLFRPGEEVYGCRAPALEDEMDKRRRPYGTLAEFCICDESEVAHKPWTLTHEQAAAVPMAALTAIQCRSVFMAALTAIQVRQRSSAAPMAALTTVQCMHHADEAMLDVLVAAITAIQVRQRSGAAVLNIFVAALTGLHVLGVVQAFETARFKPKSRRSIFIMGGGSGVGNMAIQLAKEEYGATRIVAAVKPMEDAAVASVISRDESSGWPSVKVLNDDSEVAKMRGFRNFDMVLDNEGAADWLMDLKLLNSTPSGMARYMMDRKAAKYHEAAMRAGVEYHRIFPISSGQLLEAVMNPLLESGRVRPIIDSCHTFEHYGRAMRTLRGGWPRGKVVVRVAPPSAMPEPYKLKEGHPQPVSLMMRSTAAVGKIKKASHLTVDPCAVAMHVHLASRPQLVVVPELLARAANKQPRKRVVRPAFGATAVREEYDRATPATQPRSPVELVCDTRCLAARMEYHTVCMLLECKYFEVYTYDRATLATQPRSPVELAPYNEEEEEEEEEEMKLEEPETETKPKLPELSGCPFPSGMPEAAKKAFMRPKHVTMDKPWEEPAKHRRRAASEPRQPLRQPPQQQQQQQPQQQPWPMKTLSPTAQKRQASIEAGARDVPMVHSRGGY